MRGETRRSYTKEHGGYIVKEHGEGVTNIGAKRTMTPYLVLAIAFAFATSSSDNCRHHLKALVLVQV